MSKTAKAHGMDGTLVEPDWPPLTLHEVRKLLQEYPGQGGPVRILSTSPRPFSAASVVSTGGGRVFVKRHHRLIRGREGLLEEHRFIEHLRANGSPSPRVLANAAGETALEKDEWTYEVHEAPEDADLYEEAISWTPFRSIGHAYSAGRALALLHCASAGYAAPARKVQPLVSSFTIFACDDAQAGMERYLTARPALGGGGIRDACAEALQLLEPFHAELKPLLGDLAPLWTHNDLHASNLLWSDTSEAARATAVIDFGLADLTNAVHDVALAIERNIVEWLVLTRSPASFGAVPVHYEDLQALLAGYESVRALSGAEAAALAPMLAVCHAEFALTEADYFLGVRHSREQARMAVPDYLAGHARWFRSQSGERLLDSIRAWAEARTQRGGGARER